MLEISKTYKDYPQGKEGCLLDPSGLIPEYSKSYIMKLAEKFFNSKYFVNYDNWDWKDYRYIGVNSTTQHLSGFFGMGDHYVIDLRSILQSNETVRKMRQNTDAGLNNSLDSL